MKYIKLITFLLILILIGYYTNHLLLAGTIVAISIILFIILNIKITRKIESSESIEVTQDIFNLVFNTCINSKLPDIKLLTENIIKTSSNTFINNKAKVITEFYDKRNIIIDYVSVNKGMRLDELKFKERAKKDGKPISANDITRYKVDLARQLKLDETDIDFSLTNVGEDTINIILPSDKANNVRLVNIFTDPEFMSYISDNQIEKNDTCYLNDVPIVLGADSNSYVYYSAIKKPHILIAGATGSGKSVSINAIITSLLMLHTPESLELNLIDLKDGIELTDFSSLPHCKEFCDNEEDAEILLSKLETEMTRRNKLIRDSGKKSISEYNKVSNTFLPFILVVIDEFITLSKNENAIESLVQLSAKARAAGIYLLLSVQKPTANNIDSRIRSNLNVRIAFKTADQNESRVILDINDAANLRGDGDGYVKTNKITRFQGVFVGHNEMMKIIKHWKKHT